MRLVFQIAAAAGLLLAPGAASAEPASAAFLYRYKVAKPAEFNPAYQRHLAWHKEKGDHLVWYGWYAIAGAPPGTFIDGTFGASMEDVDRRPDPAGDGRHFAENVAPYAVAEETSVWALWPEVSTSFTLERRAPTARLLVLRIEAKPGNAAAFEAALARAAQAGAAEGAGGWTWYRAVAGTSHPSYLLIVPGRRWADLPVGPVSVSALAARMFAAGAVTDGLDAHLERVESEVWGYRADLSYFPEQAGAAKP